MRIAGLLMAGFCALAINPLSLSAFQLKYLGEVGHLGPQFDQRTSVRFGLILVTSQKDGGIQVHGHDDHGNPWSAALSSEGGVGWTDIWQADFDRNGRPDLLVSAYFPQNGRCIDAITLQFLLFNDHGQPVPWAIQTRMPESSRFPRIPAIFTDVGRGGAPQLVVTDCSYSDPPRFGEDRRITGIYEAKDATWSLSRPVDLGYYTGLVRRNHRLRPGHDQLFSVDPGRWADHGNKMDLHGPPPVKLAAVLPASPDCRGVRLPPIVDGQLQTGWKDPCEEIGKDRLQLSSGTVCYGWPTVLIDGANERQIVACPRGLKPALTRIIDQGRTVVLAGETDPEKCTPVVLWAPEIKH